MQPTKLKAKSNSVSPKAYIWILVDHGGEFKAVCVEAKDIKEALNQGYWAKASAWAYSQFKRGKLVPEVSSSGLVDATGQRL